MYCDDGLLGGALVRGVICFPPCEKLVSTFFIKLSLKQIPKNRVSSHFWSSATNTLETNHLVYEAGGGALGFSPSTATVQVLRVASYLANEIVTYLFLSIDKTFTTTDRTPIYLLHIPYYHYPSLLQWELSTVTT